MSPTHGAPAPNFVSRIVVYYTLYYIIVHSYPSNFCIPETRPAGSHRTTLRICTYITLFYTRSRRQSGLGDAARTRDRRRAVVRDLRTETRRRRQRRRRRRGWGRRRSYILYTSTEPIRARGASRTRASSFSRSYGTSRETSASQGDRAAQSDRRRGFTRERRDTYYL